MSLAETLVIFHGVTPSSNLPQVETRESGRGGSGLDLPSSGSSTANIQAFLIPAPDSVKDELKKFLELSYS